MRKLIALTLGVLAVASALATLPNRAAWPQGGKVIHIILTVPPGGSIDVLFRIVTDYISTTKGQTFVIESRPGAGGVIAAEVVARATPDGTTLLSNNNGTIISSILRKVNYDPLTSFEPICYLVTTPQLVVVNSASPYRTLAELIAAARAKPGELSIIGIERLKKLAKADLTYVSFPGGAPTVNALLGNHVTSAVLNWSEIGEQVKAGKARALATMALRHIEPLPDLPTVSESGYQGFETDVWFGVTAPAKTPKETAAQLIEWFKAALADPDVKAKLASQALYARPICGDDFNAYLRRQSELFAQLIRELNFKTQ
jgi:tripartite-type tricarboxylate transporter receptor subunit TctC